MANGQITSGDGIGPVKKYVSRRGQIEVAGLAVPGATVGIVLRPVRGPETAPEWTSGNPWSKSISAAPGKYTLAVTIRCGDEEAKAMTQEIEVVSG